MSVVDSAELNNSDTSTDFNKIWRDFLRKCATNVFNFVHLSLNCNYTILWNL